MATFRLRYSGAIPVVGLLLAGIWFSLLCDPTARAQNVAKPTAMWEYCELVNNEKGHCSYSTARENIGAGSWKELADKLRVPQKDGEKVGNPRLLVFDYLGGQGWELVSHGVMVINASYGETFLFKRRIEK
jgi:hypothetical protein